MKEKPSDENEEVKSEVQEGNELSVLESHHSKGNRLYYEEHDYEKAIEEYEEALKDESDELVRTKITYVIAESYVKIGNLKKARELFEQIAEKHKEHYLNDSARKRLIHLEDYLIEKEEKKK